MNQIEKVQFRAVLEAAKMKKAEELLKGAYDFHVHTSPDILPRRLSDTELGKMAKKFGMGGFIIKSHYSPTSDRAQIANQLIKGIKIYGGTVLNNSVGGLNPQAVDIAGRLGGKMIWLPTVDSDNERQRLNMENTVKAPYWAVVQRDLSKRGMLNPAISMKDADGKLVPQVDEILELVADYSMILSTGHIKPSDTMSVVRRAVEIGVRKIVVTHPEFPSTSFSKEQQKELATLDVYFERCFTTASTGKTTFDYIIEEILATGFEKNILSTDLGQADRQDPPVGFLEFIKVFLEYGFSEDAISKMLTANQERLLFD